MSAALERQNPAAIDSATVPPPQVSVIVPVYNRADVVGRAIASVRGQTLRDIEIIVVDDGSTDGLDSVLEAEDDPRLRVIRHPQRRGAAAARNTGIAAARGDCVAFLDSDDEWLPPKLERQVAMLRAAPPSVSGVTCGYHLVPDRPGRPALKTPADCATAHRLVWGCDLSPGSTLVVRRQALAQIGPFDEGLSRLEDWDWMLRCTRGHGIAVLGEPLARIHAPGRPSRAVVGASVHHIFAKHAAWVRTLGPGARRKLKSTVLLEEAVAAYREGHAAAALWLLGRAMLAWPFRNTAFYGKVFAHASRRLHRIGKSRRPPVGSRS
jgi:glycosyltransferase involved in cell wall biosynthesis